MSYCPRCGNKIDQDMAFCPKCGAALKGSQAQTQAPPPPTPPTYRRRDEKGEKEEKGEKGEKREKREHPYIGPLIGGLVVLFLGIVFFLQAADIITAPNERYVGPLIFIVIGIIIILAAIYGAIVMGRRYPRTA